MLCLIQTKMDLFQQVQLEGHLLPYHALKRSFLITFMQKKPYLKAQILPYKFLDWKGPIPPPFRNFQKIHLF